MKTETGSFRSSGRIVDYRYSRKTDTLWLHERGRKIVGSKETPIGIVDFDATGDIVGIEIFAGRHVVRPCPAKGERGMVLA